MIETYVPAEGMDPKDQETYLSTHLDGFLGTHGAPGKGWISYYYLELLCLSVYVCVTHPGNPYNYDDQELSEQWMRTLAGDDSLHALRSHGTTLMTCTTTQKEMIRAQVSSVIGTLIRRVQDDFSNQEGTLRKPQKVTSRDSTCGVLRSWGVFMDGCPLCCYLEWNV